MRKLTEKGTNTPQQLANRKPDLKMCRSTIFKLNGILPNTQKKTTAVNPTSHTLALKIINLRKLSKRLAERIRMSTGKLVPWLSPRLRRLLNNNSNYSNPVLRLIRKLNKVCDRLQRKKNRSYNSPKAELRCCVFSSRARKPQRR